MLTCEYRSKPRGTANGRAGAVASRLLCSNRGKTQVRVTVGPVATLSRTPSGRETDTKARLALQAASQVRARGQSTPKIATLFPARRRRWQGARSWQAPALLESLGPDS